MSENQPQSSSQSTPITMGSTQLRQIVLKGTIVDASTIAVTYAGLPGNMPNVYGNFIALWEDTQIPTNGEPPLAQKTIIGNTLQGSQAFDDLSLQDKPYILGYGTGSDISTICSTVTFMPGNIEGTEFATSLSVRMLGSDTLIVTFNTPEGNDPQGNKNWIGLWEGHSFTYDGRHRIVKVSVDKGTNEGSMILNGLPLKFNTYYTVVYAMGDNDTTIAAAYTFHVAGF